MVSHKSKVVRVRSQRQLHYIEPDMHYGNISPSTTREIMFHKMPTSTGEPSVPQPVDRVFRLPKSKSQHHDSENTRSQSPTSPPTSTISNNLHEIETTTKWSTRKKVIVGLIIAAVCIVIIVTVIVTVLLTRQSNTTASTTNTTVVYVLWSFDNVTTDSYGVYNGQLMNSATYSPSSSTMPYLGQGRALSVTAAQNQSFQVSTPFLNLASTSFTIEAWIYSTIVTGDNGIMGQCQCTSCSNQCFFFLIRSSKLYVGFTLNDINGLTTMTVNTWYHVAFVYNSVTKQQILYLNGVQDNIKSSSSAYQGTNGTFTIGSAKYYPSTTFFNGYIDNVKIETLAKSATEILTAASLIAYYSFDSPNPTYDNGPNGLNGSSINAGIVTGRVNQGIQFTGSSSYFQAYGFYQAGYGVNSNKPFSISMWISTSSYSSCAFVQMSTAYNGGSCFNMLGIWSYTGNAAQLVAQGYAWPAIYGPSITLNTWTHVSWTFSLTNGYRLYVNGVYFGTTGYYSYSGTSGVINWLQIGYSFTCSGNYISNAAFQGIIDEIYVHNREITATEVYTFANP
ncbi:unnamed protein product [Rotaria sordida]|uniref:Uncharacterized protein n=1 Tax=Rotaria sordida TaxID=392033 RepID=A0A814TSZ1_9BILA|nr:unnamed protein product [Rotaria sordida]CAF1415902.1 unnamed protein product [Rotaria sordida]